MGVRLLVSLGLKIKGIATLVKTDIRTGKVETVKRENVFTNLGYNAVFNDASQTASIFSTSANAPTRIILSTQTRVPSADNPDIEGTLYPTYNPGDTEKLVWNESTPTENAYVQVVARSDSAGYDKTFQTIALSNKGVTVDATTKTITTTGIKAYAYLRLDSPITQGEFEIIDIFYRFYVQKTVSAGYPQNSYLPRALVRKFFGISTTINYNIVLSSIASLKNVELFNYLSTGYSGSTVYISNYELLKLDKTKDTSKIDQGIIKVGGKENNKLDNFTGIVVKSLQYGYLIRKTTLTDFPNTHEPIIMSQLIPDGSNPIQTIWGKKSSAKRFSFIAEETSIGTGKVEAQLQPAWTGGFPTMFQIVISQSGAIGTSRYRLRRQNFITYKYSTTTLPTQEGQTLPHLGGFLFRPDEFIPGGNGTEQQRNIIGFREHQLIYWNSTGITVVDILSTDFRIWSNSQQSYTNQESISVTNIAQLYTDNQYIYIACRDTGLWRIDYDNAGNSGSVVNLTTTPCYGISTANYQSSTQIYIVTPNGITSSDSNYSVYYNPNSPSLNGNWSQILSITGNPNSPSQNAEIGMVMTDGGTATILWWNRTSNTIIEATGHIVTDFEPDILQVSPNGTWWVLANQKDYTEAHLGRVPRAYRLTFGTEEGTLINFSSNTTFVQIGCFTRDNVFVVSGSSTDVRIIPEIVPSNNYGIAAPNKLFCAFPGVPTLPPKMVYFPKSNMIFVGGSIQSWDYNYWEEYGWDGSNWVLDHPGDKATHTNFEAIPEGLGIKFDPNNSSSPFVASDFYVLPVCDGILGDNATYLNCAGYLYNRELESKIAFVGASVPNSSPYTYTVPAANTNNFYRLLIEDRGVLSINLNGNVVNSEDIQEAKSEPTAPGLINVDPETGTLYFNSSDAGKAINGYFSYLKS